MIIAHFFPGLKFMAHNKGTYRHMYHQFGKPESCFNSSHMAIAQEWAKYSPPTDSIWPAGGWSPTSWIGSSGSGLAVLLLAVSGISCRW